MARLHRFIVALVILSSCSGEPDPARLEPTTDLAGTEHGADGVATGPREFPLATPSLGGFTLVDAVPPGTVRFPSALVWTKGALSQRGGRSFVLERAGKVLQLERSRVVLDFASSVAMSGESGA